MQPSHKKLNLTRSGQADEAFSVKYMCFFFRLQLPIAHLEAEVGVHYGTKGYRLLEVMSKKSCTSSFTAHESESSAEDFCEWSH